LAAANESPRALNILKHIARQPRPEIAGRRILPKPIRLIQARIEPSQVDQSARREHAFRIRSAPRCCSSFGVQTDQFGRGLPAEDDMPVKFNTSLTSRGESACIENPPLHRDIVEGSVVVLPSANIGGCFEASRARFRSPSPQVLRRKRPGLNAPKQRRRIEISSGGDKGRV